MKAGIQYLSIFVIFLLNINTSCSGNKSGSLSRHKRYVVFPEGSSLTVAFCITMNLIEVRTTIFTELINFGINYDLPNRTLHHLLKSTEPKETARRRYRRDLYNKVEIILNAMGLDGPSCVYRALCEVVQVFEGRGENMMEEIIRRLFHFPLDNLHYSEHEAHKQYLWAHKMGHEQRNCHELYPNCHVSLVEMLLGYKPFNDD